MKVNFKNQIQNFGGLIIMSIFYYAPIFYIEKDFLKIWYWHLPIIILLIPTLFIHISYLQENYNDEFVISKKSIIDKNKNVEYKIDSIYKIVIYKYAGLGRSLPFHDYQYCKVILKNGESFTLTSLLKYHIGDFLKQKVEGVVFENSYTFFPSL